MKWYNQFLRPHPGGEGHGLETFFTPAPLMVGWLTHEGLAQYYRSGASTGEYLLEEGVRAVNSGAAARAKEFQSEQDRDDAVSQSIVLLNNYHLWYTGGSGELDYPRLKIAQHPTTGLPMVEQDFEVDLGYRGYIYTGRLDAICTWDDRIYSLEHKTTTASYASRLIQDMHINTQVTGQCFLLDSCIPELDPQGVLINLIVKRVAKGKAPCRRDISSRTPARLEKFRTDIVKTLRQIEEDKEQYEDLLKAGMEPDEAARQSFLENTSKCVDFSPCTFYSMCRNPGKEGALSTSFRPRTITKEEFPSA